MKNDRMNLMGFRTKPEGFDPRPMQKVIREEQAKRVEMAMVHLSLVQRIKAAFNYYFCNAEYPQIKDILVHQVTGLKKTYDQLSSVLGDLEQTVNGNRRFYTQVITDMIAHYRLMQKSDSKRADYQRVIHEIDARMDNAHDLEQLLRLEMKKNNLIHAWHNASISYAESGYRIYLGRGQLQELQGIRGFLASVELGTRLALTYARVSAEQVDNIMGVYDMLPRTANLVLDIRKRQDELQQTVAGYKPVLARLYRHQYDELSQLLGARNARSVLEPMQNNIRMLNTTEYHEQR